MRNVEKTFTKKQLKFLGPFLRATEKSYPVKFQAMLAILKENGFLYQNGKIVADPDYKEETK